MPLYEMGRHSPWTEFQTSAASMPQVLSVLAEIFVFCYIGSSISINTDAWRHGITWATLVRQR